MKNYTKLFIVVFIGIFFLNACGGASSGTPTSKPANTGAAPTAAGLVPDLQVAALDSVSSNNVWALFDYSGSTFWNQLAEANYYPTLYSLTSIGDSLIPVAAADLPSSFSREGNFFVASVILKPNLVWTDSYPVTARDVAFTINTALKFRLGFNWQSWYDPIILDHVEALDGVTVKYFFTQQPGDTNWKYGALMGAIVSKNFWEPKIAPSLELLGDGSDEAARANAISELEKLAVSGEPVFGIYKQNDWRTGNYFENVSNPNSFFSNLVTEQFTDGSYKEYKSDNSYQWEVGDITGKSAYRSESYITGPYFERIRFTSGDSDTSYLNLRNGNTSVVFNPYGLPLALTGQLESNTALKSATTRHAALSLLAINQKRKVFSGDAGTMVRNAIACMINQDDLAVSLLQGQVLPAYSLVPADNKDWVNPNVTSNCFGLSEGNRLIKATGFLTSRGYDYSIQYPIFNPSSPQESQIVSGQGLADIAGTPFPELVLLSPPPTSNPLGAAAADYIARQLLKLGITVKIETQGIGDRLSRLTTGDYDLALLSYGLPANPIYLCSIFNSGSPTNPFGYSSTVLAQQCALFAIEPDPTKLQALAFTLQSTLSADLPVIPLFSNTMVQTYRIAAFPYLTGGSGPIIFYEPHPLVEVVSIQ